MNTLRQPAVFLDRDGVLNRPIIRQGKPYPPISVSEFEILPGVIRSCRLIKEAGFKLFVVTNQPDVARGTQDREVVESMHKILREYLPLDDIAVCFHDSADRCECRKPSPGMVHEIARRYDINLENSYLIGDRWRDVDCARNAKCTSVFIDYGYDESLNIKPDAVVTDFSSAASWIVQDSQNKSY